MKDGADKEIYIGDKVIAWPNTLETGRTLKRGVIVQINEPATYRYDKVHGCVVVKPFKGPIVNIYDMNYIMKYKPVTIRRRIRSNISPRFDLLDL